MIESSRKVNSIGRDRAWHSTTTLRPSCLYPNARVLVIRFAVEEFPAIRTLGAWMHVGDERFDSDEICRLYESSDYPLARDVSA
jgi:hypothetical protein